MGSQDSLGRNGLYLIKSANNQLSTDRTIHCLLRVYFASPHDTTLRMPLLTELAKPVSVSGGDKLVLGYQSQGLKT